MDEHHLVFGDSGMSLLVTPPAQAHKVVYRVVTPAVHMMDVHSVVDRELPGTRLALPGVLLPYLEVVKICLYVFLHRLSS